MAKDQGLRLQETLAHVPTLVGAEGRGEQIRTLLQSWVRGLPDADQTRLSTGLSFGERHLFDSAADLRLRHHRRALLMARAYLNMEYQGGQYRPRVPSMSATAVKDAFLALFGHLPASAPDQDCAFAPSFDYATDAERERVVLAWREARARLRKTVTCLGQVRQVAQEKTRFVKWFGTYTDSKLSQVLMNFQSLASFPKRPCFFYRGPGLRVARSPKEVVPPNDAPVAIYPETDAGFYSRDDARDANPDYVYVFLGEGMFGAKVADRFVRGVSASRSGVLIHELSHAICRTNDEPGTVNGKMYGYACCLQAAAANNTRVLTNADSYRMYADELQD
jgi:hypothetical protein